MTEEGRSSEDILEDILTILNSMTSKIDTMNNLLTSINTYMYNTYTLWNNSVSVPYATKLIQEYYNNQDLDGNSKKYGIDFTISNKPKMLENITVPNGLTSMTWEEYLAEIS